MEILAGILTGFRPGGANSNQELYALWEKALNIYTDPLAAEGMRETQRMIQKRETEGQRERRSVAARERGRGTNKEGREGARDTKKQSEGSVEEREKGGRQRRGEREEY